MRSTSTSLSSFKPSCSGGDLAEHNIRGGLPENMVARREWTTNGHHSQAGLKSEAAIESYSGDATGDVSRTESGAKKILVGIERKGRELRQQISVKLTGAKDKTERKLDLNAKTFFPRMEKRGIRIGQNHPIQ